MYGEIMTVRQLNGNRIGKGGPELAETMVAHLCGVRREDLHAATRLSSQVAFARQITMYLYHVVYGRSLSEIALTFGRNRTTASYACHKVEDRRDDPLFDKQVSQLETLCRLVRELEALS